MAFSTPTQQLPAHLSLKQRLLAGESSYGILLCTASPIVAEVLSICGYDMVVVDADHSPAGTLASMQILQALGSSGSAGVIRVPENSPLYLKKALDSGPAGIIIPTIDSADAAKRAVASCKYAPGGIRGYSSPTVRASMYGLHPDYMRKPEDYPLVIAQIESELAVGRISEIASVDGIDCLILSPDDLAASIGKLREPDQDEVQRLIRRAEEAVVSSGKLLGSFLSSCSMMNAQEMFMRGYSVVIGTSDIALLRDNARADVVRVRGVGARVGMHQAFPPMASLQTPENKPPPLANPQPTMHSQHQVMMARMAPMGAPPTIPGLPGVGSGLPAGMGMLSLQHANHQGGPIMPFPISRRGGRGTPKRCSHCHMPLKEGHKEDCVAWERKKRMKLVESGLDPAHHLGGNGSLGSDREGDTGASTPGEDKVIIYNTIATSMVPMAVPSDEGATSALEEQVRGDHLDGIGKSSDSLAHQTGKALGEDDVDSLQDQKHPEVQ